MYRTASWVPVVSSIERFHCALLSTYQSSEPTLITEDMPTLDRHNRVSIGVLTGWARKERGREGERLEERRRWKKTEGSREREGGVQRNRGEGKTYICECV